MKTTQDAQKYPISQIGQEIFSRWHSELQFLHKLEEEVLKKHNVPKRLRAAVLREARNNGSLPPCQGTRNLLPSTTK